MDELYPYEETLPGNVILDVQNLSGKAFSNVTFQVHRGEILGITGLIGSGRTELLRAIFGVDGYIDGKVSINGKRVKRGSPDQSLRNGLVLLPENRKDEGLWVGMSVSDNVSMSNLRALLGFA